jgi:hypothetical protein
MQLQEKPINTKWAHISAEKNFMTIKKCITSSGLLNHTMFCSLATEITYFLNSACIFFCPSCADFRSDEAYRI